MDSGRSSGGVACSGCAVWSLANPADLSLRGWEDELVVHDDLGGQTHLLNPLAAWIVQFLVSEGVPVSAEGIVSRVSSHDASDEDSARAEVIHVLTELEGLGLLTRSVP